MGWALARKGKATSNVTYNPDDPPSAYSNRPSTVVSKRTQRWKDRSMGQTGIRGPSPLMEKSL